MMNFQRFISNSKSEDAKRKAAEGFAERQAEREKRFKAESDAREPSAEWYGRMYGVRRTKHQGGAE